MRSERVRCNSEHEVFLNLVTPLLMEKATNADETTCLLARGSGFESRWLQQYLRGHSSMVEHAFHQNLVAYSRLEPKCCDRSLAAERREEGSETAKWRGFDLAAERREEGSQM